MLVCLTIIGIPAGLALMAMGWWVAARAKKNVRLVEEVYAEFTTPRAVATA